VGGAVVGWTPPDVFYGRQDQGLALMGCQSATDPAALTLPTPPKKVGEEEEFFGGRGPLVPAPSVRCRNVSDSYQSGPVDAANSRKQAVLFYKKEPKNFCL
jgi:hypothetical protein